MHIENPNKLNGSSALQGVTRLTVCFEVFPRKFIQLQGRREFYVVGIKQRIKNDFDVYLEICAVYPIIY